MGLTKTSLFTSEQNKLAEITKCLAHPARVAILQYLMKKNTCINTLLIDEIGLAQATISQHLKALKDAGFIRGTIEGKSMSYCIDQENWKMIQQTLNNFFDASDKSQSHTCC
jgi:predicted transcriptional regulator